MNLINRLFFDNFNKHYKSSWHYQEFTYCQFQVQQFIHFSNAVNRQMTSTLCLSAIFQITECLAAHWAAGCAIDRNSDIRVAFLTIVHDSTRILHVLPTAPSSQQVASLVLWLYEDVGRCANVSSVRLTRKRLEHGCPLPNQRELMPVLHWFKSTKTVNAYSG